MIVTMAVTSRGMVGEVETGQAPVSELLWS